MLKSEIVFFDTTKFFVWKSFEILGDFKTFKKCIFKGF